MISNELKDRVLSEIVNTGVSVEFNIRSYASDLGCSGDELDAVIRHFEARHLLNAKRCLGGRVLVTVEVDAHDFVRRGGFTAQEELLKKNIEKLLLEIESLKPSMPDKVEQITSIAGSIATALGLFISR